MHQPPLPPQSASRNLLPFTGINSTTPLLRDPETQSQTSIRHHFMSATSLPLSIRILLALTAIRPFHSLFNFPTSQRWQPILLGIFSWLYILAFLGYSCYSLVYFVQISKNFVTDVLPSIFALCTYAFGLYMNHFSRLPDRARQLAWVSTAKYLDNYSLGVPNLPSEAHHKWISSLRNSQHFLIFAEYVFLLIIPLIGAIFQGVEGGVNLTNVNLNQKYIPWYQVNAVVFPIWFLRGCSIMIILGQYCLLCWYVGTLIQSFSKALTLHPHIFKLPSEAFSEYFAIFDTVDSISYFYSGLILPYIIFSTMWVLGYLIEYSIKPNSVFITNICISFAFLSYLTIPPAIVTHYSRRLVDTFERTAALSTAWDGNWSRFLSFLRNSKPSFSIGAIQFTPTLTLTVFYFSFIIVMVTYNLAKVI